ncbi:hypothetical protein VCV18_011470 [Metarhizium anisopliae]
MDFDILAIQEPWVNPFVDTTHHPAKDLFHLCYPQAEGESSARGDKAAEIKIHNIYNPNHTVENRQSVLPQLRRMLESAQQAEQIVLGDLALHHEMWGGPNVPKTEAEAEDLVAIMEDYNLTSTLIPGTITYEEGERQATIDLCLVTVGLADRVIRSGVDREFDHDSDHLPVVTSFDMSIKQLSREPRKNWKSIDEKKFKSVVLRNLPPLGRPRTRSALDQCAGEIVAALQNAIETAVPRRAWSPKARRGWDEECMRALAETKRLRRLHNLYHTDETWEAYRKARNHKGRVIKKALRRGPRENVEKASESPEALWKMAREGRYLEKSVLPLPSGSRH